LAKVVLYPISCHGCDEPAFSIPFWWLEGLLMFVEGYPNLELNPDPQHLWSLAKKQLDSSPPEVPIYPPAGRPLSKTPKNPDLRLKTPKKVVLVGLVGAQLWSVESGDGPVVIVKLFRSTLPYPLPPS
jgi:hypothetical protein